MDDHYALLGIACDADAAAIRAAYRRRMRQAHPDVARDDGSAAQALNHAFAVLSDPDERAAYDRSLGRSAGPLVPVAGAPNTPLVVAGNAEPPRREPLPIGWIVILAILMNALLILGIATGGRF